MSENLREIANKKIEEMALTITPEAAYNLSISYAFAVLKEDKNARENFYKIFQENSGMPENVISKIKEDCLRGNFPENAIFEILSEKTKDYYARMIVREAYVFVHNVMCPADRI